MTLTIFGGEYLKNKMRRSICPVGVMTSKPFWQVARMLVFMDTVRLYDPGDVL